MKAPEIRAKLAAISNAKKIGRGRKRREDGSLRAVVENRNFQLMHEVRSAQALRGLTRARAIADVCRRLKVDEEIVRKAIQRYAFAKSASDYLILMECIEFPGSGK